MKKRSETLGLLLLLLFLVLVSMGYSVSADYTFDDNTVFEIGNENYTFPSGGITFSTVVQNASWIRFNNTDFNITSTNNIDIVLSYLNDNIAGASAGDTVLSFSADSSGGLVYFNLSGFSPSTVYTLYRDNTAIDTYTADANGVLNMTNNVWSNHDFDVKTGSFASSREVKVDYERSSIAGISGDSYGVLSLMPVIALVVVAAAILVLITKKGEL